MINHEDKIRLYQEDRIKNLLRNYGANEMLTVYRSEYIRGCTNFTIYAVLIPNNMIQNILERAEWDMRIGSGLPGVIMYENDGGERKCKYLRYGNDDGIEPIVLIRDLHGIIKGYPELSQEFILWHNLHHISERGEYIKFDECGNEILVANVNERHVQIRVKEIREFLAVKGMYLSIQFDCDERSIHSLNDLDLEEMEEEIRTDNAFLIRRVVNMELDEIKSFSSIMGKVLISPFDKSLCEFVGLHARESKFAEFIIGLDDEGKEIIHTSNPETLSNYFGKNPNSPHYLTPVHFRKAVLGKYYDNPSRYTVEDSYIRCAGLWGIRIDNHHDDKVIAWLGDLGSDLPYEEQLHWRQYNIPPRGGLSETYFRRSIMAEFAPSGRLEDEFVEKYNELLRLSQERLGWKILLPMQKRDEHLIKIIHIPLTNEQKEFDELILSMAKLIIDSINVKMLKEESEDNLKDVKSIELLEHIMKECSIYGYQEHISFLRGLQGIRSTGSAHRKGGNYKNALKKMDLDGKDKKSDFVKIMRGAIKFFEFMIDVLKSGCIR